MQELNAEKIAFAKKNLVDGLQSLLPDLIDDQIHIDATPRRSGIQIRLSSKAIQQDEDAKLVAMTITEAAQKRGGAAVISREANQAVINLNVNNPGGDPVTDALDLLTELNQGKIADSVAEAATRQMQSHREQREWSANVRERENRPASGNELGEH